MRQAAASPTTARFLHVLAQRDFQELARLFQPDAKFRALVPPGFRESTGPDATAHLRSWFGDAEAIEIVASAADTIGDRSSLSYRLRVCEDGTWSVVAQRAFFLIEDGKIAAMDLLCSGFWPESE
jgi:hypothetical protein